MITLICTKCKATLEMDDAFAGGVCRCQYCGTIQTVPSHLKQATRGTVVGAASQKALYSTKAASGAGLPSSGLDELANVVASSGLASGLAHRTATPQRNDHSASTAATKSKTPMLIAMGGIVAVLVGVIVFLLVSRGTPTPAPSPQTGQEGSGPIPTPSQVNTSRAGKGPNFLDIPIDGNRVVYLLDRGQSGRDVLDPLKAALYQSLDSLGADRDFQVMFWTIPSSSTDKPNPNEFAYPKNGVAKANKDRIEECRRVFEDLTTSGRTDLGPVLTEAMKRNPQVIIIATAKGINLDDSAVAQVEKARGGKKVVIHTVDLTRTADGMKVLRAIADKSGGTFKHIEPSVLRSW